MDKRDYIDGKMREKRRSLVQLRTLLSTYAGKLNVATPEDHTAYSMLRGKMCAARRDIRYLETLRKEI